MARQAATGRQSVNGRGAVRRSGRHPRREDLPSRYCTVCARRLEWRRKWAACWDQVRYCSERCRRRRLRGVDERMEYTIRMLLEQRPGSICPSEAARAVSPEDWRPLMETARSAGRRMAVRGEVVVQQQGRAIDPEDLRGTVRFAKGPRFGAGGLA